MSCSSNCPDAGGVADGLSYGPQLAFLTLSLYLTQGAFGLPVFAGGAAGLTALLGPTGGIFLASWWQAVFSD